MYEDWWSIRLRTSLQELTLLSPSRRSLPYSPLEKDSTVPSHCTVLAHHVLGGYLAANSR